MFIEVNTIPGYFQVQLVNEAGFEIGFEISKYSLKQPFHADDDSLDTIPEIILTPNLFNVLNI